MSKQIDSDKLIMILGRMTQIIEEIEERTRVDKWDRHNITPIQKKIIILKDNVNKLSSL
ncbi:hypothetical protein ACDN41_12450 [Priestia aryabhattai]|uniref:hypothetical protein n=1 Tax=Priestia aryabhattai TaxID=412384 RepID=UPI003531C2E4